MRSRILPPVIAVALAVSLACGDPSEPPVEGRTPVSVVHVVPGMAFVDPGDTLQLSAVALDSGGSPVSDAGLTWRSLSAAATVDETGRVIGAEPGEARIEAVAWNGVVGGATVRVTPVESISPNAGRYGEIVTLTGTELPGNVTVSFSGPEGTRVRAYTRGASPGSIEVWVPVHARDGPLQLVSPGDSIVTSREFRLVADEDVYAGHDSATLSFPYHNPSLLARDDTPHRFRFDVTEPTPFSLVLADRGDPNVETAVRAWLFRYDTDPVTLTAFVMTRDYVGDGAVLDSAVYSRASLPPGQYVLLVAAMDLAQPGAGGARRPFGIRLEAAQRFALAPDPFDPNDFPAEAPVLTLPFAAADLRAENGHAMDHYMIEVEEASTLTATSATSAPWLFMMLFRGDLEDILAAWDRDGVVAESDGQSGQQQIQATVPAGRYSLLVWEWGGRARTYSLEITTGTAAATAATVPGTADVASGKTGHGMPHPRRAMSVPAPDFIRP